MNLHLEVQIVHDSMKTRYSEKKLHLRFASGVRHGRFETHAQDSARVRCVYKRVESRLVLDYEYEVFSKNSCTKPIWPGIAADILACS